MVRRLVFSHVGYFDESLRTQEDWDMFVRIVRRFSIKTIDIPLLKIRRHDTSLSASWDRMYPGALKVLKRAIDSQLLTNFELKLVIRRMAHTHLTYGKALIVGGNVSQGREKLLAAIKINPWQSEPYFYLAISLLGNRLILTLKSWKKRVKGQSFRQQESAVSNP
jgi:hypothetical protein